VALISVSLELSLPYGPVKTTVAEDPRLVPLNVTVYPFLIVKEL